MPYNVSSGSLFRALTNSLDVSTTSFSLFCWYHSTGLIVNRRQLGIGIATASADYSVSLSADSSRHRGIMRSTSQNANTLSVDDNNADSCTSCNNGWVPGGVVYDQGNNQISTYGYVGAVAASSTPGGASPLGGDTVYDNFRIGADVADNQRHPGHIVHVAVWASVLSLQDYQALFDGANPLAVGTPFLYYALDSDGNLSDSSPTGEGDLTSNAVWEATPALPSVDPPPAPSAGVAAQVSFHQRQQR